MKYGKYSLGQIEAMINKLGGEEGADALLRDDLIIQPKPLPFPKNEYGHYALTIVGRNLTGKQEVEQGFRVSNYTKRALTSTNDDGYDANHRLEDSVEYHVVLIPGLEITENRTTANIRKYACGFGYEIPRAGVMPRICEMVSDRQMEQMKIWYIAILHEPIKDADGDPCVLRTYRRDDGRWLHARWGPPDRLWGGAGAFAFLVPAS